MEVLEVVVHKRSPFWGLRLKCGGAVVVEVLEVIASEVAVVVAGEGMCIASGVAGVVVGEGRCIASGVAFAVVGVCRGG